MTAGRQPRTSVPESPRSALDPLRHVRAGGALRPARRKDAPVTMNKKVAHTSSVTRRHPSARSRRGLNTIRAWLGHVSLDTTNIYAEIDLETKAKALATCDISAGLRRTKPWRTQPALMKFLHGL